MTEHKNVYAALCAAQSEFGKVQKGSTNPAFKSKYADLADVAGVAIPTLNAHQIAVLQYMIGGPDDRAMRTEFVHAPSESKVQCDIPLIVAKNDMQGMKSATTYAKRIGLESLSGIAPDDDDGNAAAKSPPPPRQEPKVKPQQPDESEVAKGIIEDIDAARGDHDELTRLWGNYKSVMASMSDDNYSAVKKAFEAAGNPPKSEPEPKTNADLDDEIPF